MPGSTRRTIAKPLAGSEKRAANNHFWRNTRRLDLRGASPRPWRLPHSGLATPARPDKTVKIGVTERHVEPLRRHRGPNSVAAVKMAVEDSGLVARAGRSTWSARPPEQPDVGLNIARQWIDQDKVDVISDHPEFRRRAGGHQPREREEHRASQLGCATADLTAKPARQNTISYTYDT